MQGKCDICGNQATVRVRTSVNGRTQTMELCDVHYRDTLRRQGRTASPLESLFGRRGSLFEEFFGEHPFRSLMADRGFDMPPMQPGNEEAVVDASFGDEAPLARSTRRQGAGFA
ncbi:Clp protease ClpC, partial [Rubellimicrobium sp. CFH 75288]|nr:Clp protease ClpC [Rubellimicrobium sp. CFH 75288]